MPSLQSWTPLILSKELRSSNRTFENSRIGDEPICDYVKSNALSTEEEDDKIFSRYIAKENLKPLSVISEAIRPTGMANIQQLKRRNPSDAGPRSEKANVKPLIIGPREKNNWKLYKVYARTNGYYSIVLYVTALLLHIFLAAGIEVWIKAWTEANDNQDRNHNYWPYIGEYLALGLGAAMFSGIQTYWLLVHCSLQV
jgi:hypothetical protein